MASQDTHLAVQELAGQTAPAGTPAPEAGQADQSGKQAEQPSAGDQGSQL